MQRTRIQRGGVNLDVSSSDKNPITGPVRGSGVRQSAKSERIPDVLEIEEFQLLQAELQIRERILVWLDMTLGLRRGELAGLR
jgi:integrase